MNEHDEELPDVEVYDLSLPPTEHAQALEAIPRGTGGRPRGRRIVAVYCPHERCQQRDVAGVFETSRGLLYRAEFLAPEANRLTLDYYRSHFPHVGRVPDTVAIVEVLLDWQGPVDARRDEFELRAACRHHDLVADRTALSGAVDAYRKSRKTQRVPGLSHPRGKNGVR